jgi:hypothetical protein
LPALTAGIRREGRAMEFGRRIFLLLLAAGASAAGVFRGGTYLHAAAEEAGRSSGSGISGNP